MAFSVLDASAFYAGVPFSSLDKYCTTSLVYDEIKHIKKSHDALGLLLNTKRLTIVDPTNEQIQKVKLAAKKTGDLPQLSKQDISCIALALQLEVELVTDDFAVLNVAKILGLKTSPIMTEGIKKVGNWIFYCRICHKKFSQAKECPICGNPLRRKLQKSKIS